MLSLGLGVTSSLTSVDALVRGLYSAGGVLPRVALDFDDNKYVTDVGPVTFADAFTGNNPKLTYATTSNSTMVNSAGHLVWAPHNLLTYSEDHSQGTTVEDATLSGNTLTATVQSGNQFPEINRTFTVPTGTTTWWADIENLTNVSYVTMATQLFDADALGVSVFELGATPNVATQSANHTATITEVEPGVYRCSITFTTDGTDNAGRLALGMSDLSTLHRVVDPDGTESMDIVRQQLNRSDLGGMAPVPGAVGDFEYYVPTNGNAEYLPRVGHHVYNGSAWVNEGLLIESEERTNLVTYSEDFSQWTASSGTTVTAGATSPTGQTDAYQITLAGNNDNVQLTTAGLSTSTAVQYSVYLRVSSGTQSVNLGNINAGQYQSVTVTTEWQRFVITQTPSATTRFPRILNGTNDSFTVEAFGAQIEQNATASSHIPTSGATVTRAAQTLVVPPAAFGWPEPEYIGSELITNGLNWTGATENTPPTGWTKAGSSTQYTITTGGELEIDRNGESGANTTQTITTEVGKLYQLSLDYIATSSNNQTLLVQVIGGVTLVSETVNTLTTHSFEFVADSTSTIIGIRPSSSTSQVVKIDNVSVREINPLSVSIQVDGRMTYADEGAFIAQRPYKWIENNDNFIDAFVRSDESLGKVLFRQKVAGTPYQKQSLNIPYSPGVLVPFNIASRHGSTFINGAVDGTALTANTTPTALPDLSSTNLAIAKDFMGTIGTFRQFVGDIGDTGLEEATSPSTEPTLSLTFDGTGGSFYNLSWSE